MFVRVLQVTFDQIAGLEFAKKSVIELVCWPMARPDIFTGLRSLPKGLLLFGPPGTGKHGSSHARDDRRPQSDPFFHCARSLKPLVPLYLDPVRPLKLPPEAVRRLR